MNIHFGLFSFVIFVGVYIGEVSLKTLHKGTRPDSRERERAEVAVTGDVEHHNDVTLHVTTPFSTRSIRLKRVEQPVLHDQLTTFTVVGEKDGVPELRFENVSRELHRKARQFFCDLDTGAVVSIVRKGDNTLHVKGFLDHKTRITPPHDTSGQPDPNSNTPREKRDLDDVSHSVWAEDDSVEWSIISRLAITPPDRRGAGDDDDDDDDDERDDDDEITHEDDYLEVPAMFKDKSLWVRPSRSASRANRRSSLHDDRRRRRRKRRRRRQALHEMTMNPFRATFSSAAPPSGFTSSVRPGGGAGGGGPFTGTYVVEVMVMVDVKTYSDFDYDAKKLEDYIMHFWQAVNLRIQAIMDPRIQLKIRSYGKILFPGFQQFIEASRVRVGTKNLVSLADVAERFRSWSQSYESNILYAAHDAAVLMTGENLCKKKHDGSCPDSPKGIGYMGGACITARRFTGYTYDVAVAEVDRSFRGVLTATHELGHLLNASHDGEGDAVSCTKSSGYIMSYTWDDAYKFNRFSSCSKNSIRRFLTQTWYADCLRDPGKDAYAFPNHLPGKAVSLKQQCSHYNAGIPCSVRPLESQCKNLCCENILTVSVSNTPAADGTTCGLQKSCFAGQCVLDTDLPKVPSS